MQALPNGAEVTSDLAILMATAMALGTYSAFIIANYLTKS